jgi:hypothetical protein
MGDVIDLTLVSNARRYFQKLLDTRGLNYFLRKDGRTALPDRAEQGRDDRPHCRPESPAHLRVRRSTRSTIAGRRSAAS